MAPRALALSFAGIHRAARAAGLFRVPWPAIRRPKAPKPPEIVPLGEGLHEVTSFGSNPGALRMKLYVPPRRPRAGAPLIVVLHGCGQEAAGFATDSGWIDMARRLGCPLLLPEQIRDNNAGLCFTWYSPADANRDSGEALSIRQMIRTASKRFASDPKRVFIVGLSAGGAMAAAMLAAYPVVFAAGAVVAGMPVGSAHSPTEALLRMRRANPYRSAGDWLEAARAAGPTRPPRKYPRLSIWQGSEDRTVVPGNAENLAI
ncbi:MAG TPA: PHB depolymerase family esterase, partial [Acetobacteraceae bacterium]